VTVGCVLDNPAQVCSLNDGMGGHSKNLSFTKCPIGTKTENYQGSTEWFVCASDETVVAEPSEFCFVCFLFFQMF